MEVPGSLCLWGSSAWLLLLWEPLSLPPWETKWGVICASEYHKGSSQGCNLTLITLCCFLLFPVLLILLPYRSSLGALNKSQARSLSSQDLLPGKLKHTNLSHTLMRCKSNNLSPLSCVCSQGCVYMHKHVHISRSVRTAMLEWKYVSV